MTAPARRWLSGTGPDPLAEHRTAAAQLLGCRPGGSAPEVRAAYRRVLKAGRPDTGKSDATWLAEVQGARDLLLAAAPADRRRRDRGAAPPAAYLPLRRATWAPDALPARDLDLRM